MTAREEAAAARAAGDRVFHVGAGRLALRLLAVALWRTADPGTLPVQPRTGRQVSLGTSPFLQVITAVAWTVALAVAAAGTVSWLHFRGVGTDFLRNPPGLSLEATAQRLESASDGIWRVLSPVASRRVIRLAGSVRQGRSALQDAARAYESAGDEFRRLGPVVRAERGDASLEPVRTALAGVRAPWLRETMAYREMEEAAAPSPESNPGVPKRLQGRITAMTPGHALQLSVLAPDGRPVEATTPVLETGAAFNLPLRTDGTLLLTDLTVRERGLFDVKEDMRIPLREWTEDPVRFPRGGTTAQVRFTGTAAGGPSLPDLSPGARTELGLPPSRDR